SVCLLNRCCVFSVWLRSSLQIVATAVCRSDLYYLLENMHEDGYPTILGHEAAGIVESVGPGVTEFLPVCLLGCGICTGYGAAVNTAKVCQFDFWK
uniref:Alcohol dehydrogenase 1-like n=1 Tax=Seriola lalandi dorsalis TaxID=1841481 RepID=A0A3B4X2N9_SERLL